VPGWLRPDVDGCDIPDGASRGDVYAPIESRASRRRQWPSSAWADSELTLNAIMTAVVLALRL
jgi:hypothetical protein